MQTFYQKHKGAVIGGAVVIFALTGVALAAYDNGHLSENKIVENKQVAGSAPAPAPRQMASSQPVQQECDDGNIVGTLVGGAAGGVVGSQVGKGKGKTAATIGGALGGAYFGNQYIPTRNVACR